MHILSDIDKLNHLFATETLHPQVAVVELEHADNSFSPLSKAYVEEFSPYCQGVYNVLKDINEIIATGDYSNAEEVSSRAKLLKHQLANLRKEQTMRLHKSNGSLRMDFVYLNLIQESHELLSEVRNLLRGGNKFFALQVTSADEPKL